ncbi:MAG: AsmA family protein, partial [Candidatus Omnitrophica bacterium]|nr:AsmA family protein [Candidatus Omnitrophota bacterium]
MKYLNTRNAIIVLIIALCLHLGVGFLASPLVSRVALSALNQHTKAKITLEGFNVWPLTLSFSMRGLSVFDPQDVSKRIVRVNNASARLSFLGLLSRRVAIAGANVDGVDVNVEGAPDGSFNIEKVMKPASPSEPSGPVSVPQGLDTYKDWFGKARRALAKRFSQQTTAQEAARKKEGTAVKREVSPFPRGKRVYFKKYRDSYIFEVGRLNIKNAVVHIKTSDGVALDVTGMTLRLSGLGIDPADGMRLTQAVLEGAVSRESKPVGNVRAHFVKKAGKDIKETYEIATRDLDLSAIRFIYQESLPVNLVKGF